MEANIFQLTKKYKGMLWRQMTCFSFYLSSLKTRPSLFLSFQSYSLTTSPDAFPTSPKNVPQLSDVLLKHTKNKKIKPQTVRSSHTPCNIFIIEIKIKCITKTNNVTRVVFLSPSCNYVNISCI